VDGNYTATCAVTVTTGSTTTGIIEMVNIPAETFMMGGSSADRDAIREYLDWLVWDDGYYNDWFGRIETPRHQVTLSAFSMGKYEVTQKQWFEVMGTTINQQPGWIDWYSWVKEEPVEYHVDYTVQGGLV